MRDGRRAIDVLPSKASAGFELYQRGRHAAAPVCVKRESRVCHSIESDVPQTGFCNMTVRSQLMKIAAQEDINFLLTNHIPRRLATRFIGWFSRIEQPMVRDLSIAIWRMFSDLDLSEAKKTEKHARLLHPRVQGWRAAGRWRSAILTSPCDAIVGASGTIAGTELLQVKGFPTRCRIWSAIRALSERRNGAMSRCGSPRPCIIAFMRRMTARSSR